MGYMLWSVSCLLSLAVRRLWPVRYRLSLVVASKVLNASELLKTCLNHLLESGRGSFNNLHKCGHIVKG